MCEPLVLLPVERWHELKAVFRGNWPRGISGYGTLDIEEQILKNGADYGFKAYVAYGDLTNGLVGIHLKGKFYEVVIQPIKEDITDLIKAVRATKLIDWRRPLQFPFAPQSILDAVRGILLEKKVFIKDMATTDTFYIDEDAPYFNVTLPPGFTFKLMTDEYAQISNDTWPHKHSGSIWYYHLLIKAKLGYGLFKDDSLVAWCYVKETGALGHLYTLEEHRRKGYGQLVLQLISDTLRREGKILFAFCVVGNEPARRLYQKLGFILSEEVHWCDVKPLE
ncbi:unnamed protein product [Leptosia nina]|uniref:N-acetyltransferase domain-containing protein n=1 Tax=Leptosia nina TaxID=320188 RepID=A0AAV1JQ60_9NEOP